MVLLKEEKLIIIELVEFLKWVGIWKSKRIL